MTLLVALLLSGDVGAWIEKLEADRAVERYQAALELGRLGDRKALPALLLALKDSESWVRLEVARSLARIGIGKREVEPLIKRLEGVAPEFGLLIAEALATARADAVEPLIEALDSDDERQKTFAIMALTMLGRHAAPAIPALVDLHKDKQYRRKASEALRRLGPWAGDDEVAELVLRLQADDEDTRWMAIRIMGAAGPGAKRAIPALRELLKDATPRVKDAAAQALKRIDVIIEKKAAHPGLLDPRLANKRAPDEFKVRLSTTRGDIDIELKREWAPRGVDRFFNLVKVGYFDDVAFFRIVDNFVAQFGIHGDRRVTAKWQEEKIKDDILKVSNRSGWLTFAAAGPNSRTTQLFFNLGDNSHLDRQGFAPVGRVISGWKVVKALYSGYREEPKQETIFYEGNAYLKREFPNLDYIRRAVLLK